MSPGSRTLLRIVVPGGDDRDAVEETDSLVDTLMGKRPELRFQYIQEHASFVRDLDV